MIWARYEGFGRRAQPGQVGTCPFCEAPVRAKCGPIVTWHWSHLPGAPCSDSWAEESDWHHRWKEWALSCGWHVEETIAKNGMRHRADVLTSSGWVIELQHSSLDVRTIVERERFYGRMVWVWDMRGRRSRLALTDRPDGSVTFRWKRPAWSLCAIRRPLYFDFGDRRLLHTTVRRIPSRYGDYDVCLGRGRWVSAHDFVARFGPSLPPSEQAILDVLRHELDAEVVAG